MVRMREKRRGGGELRGHRCERTGENTDPDTDGRTETHQAGADAAASCKCRGNLFLSVPQNEPP